MSDKFYKRHVAEMLTTFYNVPSDTVWFYRGGSPPGLPDKEEHLCFILERMQDKQILINNARAIYKQPGMMVSEVVDRCIKIKNLIIADLPVNDYLLDSDPFIRFYTADQVEENIQRKIFNGI